MEPIQAPAGAIEVEAQPGHAQPGSGAILDGKYRLGPAIGKGGMALVREARHLGLDERVAVKILAPEFRNDPNVVERFLREGRAATKIRSEHVVRMLDVGETAGAPYLVMEYLAGKDLDALVRTEGPLTTTAAVDYLLQACEAIAEAHTCGIVHRDLKPANLFLIHRADGSPCVKVLDFGISKTSLGVQPAPGFAARETLANTVMGSPNYMAPEQMESAAAADARSDIWSLGTILYELLAGRTAFEGTSITEVCAHILRSPPVPLGQARSDVPPALEAVILRCLEKEPTKRYADVGELARALEGFGSASAHGSALTISRVVGGSGTRTSRPPSQSELGTWLVARDMIEEKPVTGRRRVGGYVVALVLVVSAGAAATGWLRPQLRALAAPDTSASVQVAAATLPAGPLAATAPSSVSPAVVAPSAPAPSPPAASPSAPQAPGPPAHVAVATPAPTPVAVAHPAPPRRPHHPHPGTDGAHPPADAALPSFDAPLVPAPEATDPGAENPYVPSAAPAAPSAAPAEPLPPPPVPSATPEGSNPFDPNK